MVARRAEFETFVQQGKGFAIRSSQPDEKFVAVSSQGDFNGDGVHDVIIASDQNRAYVIYGSENPENIIDVSQLDGTNGFIVTGIRGDGSSIGIHTVGPTGGVGIDPLWDFAITSPTVDNDTGEAYIIFGTDDGSAKIDVSELDGTNGFIVQGKEEGDRLGADVAGIALFSGDPGEEIFDPSFDIVFTASGEDDGKGATYIIFGKTGAEEEISDGTIFDLSTLDGTNGFRISGINPGDQSGFSASGGGNIGGGTNKEDVNKDGFDDFIIGAPYADPKGIIDAGQVYVIFGGPSGSFPSNLELSELDGTNGFIVNGAEEGGLLGFDVSGLFFVNEEFGAPDEIFGAIGADFDIVLPAPGIGKTYVLYGSAITNNFDISTLDETSGFIIEGDGSGVTVTGTFDLNGDNVGDILIGAEGGDNAPAAAVIYGREGGRDNLNLADLEEEDGYLLDDANAVVSVSEAGFVRGFSNLPALIAAIPDSNVAYVIYGAEQTPTIGDTVIGTQDNDTLGGTALEDTIAGALGNDEILGGKGSDVLRGDINSRDSGGDVGDNDTIRGGEGDDRIGGKGGDDILFGDEGDDQIWGDAGDDILRGGLGDDTLIGDDFSGGQGKDIFVLAEGEGIDTIVDFEMNIDLIGLADGLSFGQLTFKNDEILLSNQTLAVLNGVDTMSLTGADFVTA